MKTIKFIPIGSLLLLLLGILPMISSAQDRNLDRFLIEEMTDARRQQLEKKNQEVAEVEERRYKEVLKIAKERGIPTEIELENGEKALLYDFDEAGEPLYDRNDNVQVAISSEIDSAQILYGLSGAGVEVGLWEAANGVPRATHREFNDSLGNSRIILRNAVASTGHATLVAGTIAAEGDTALAKGMAPEATILAYTSGNDVAEMRASALTDSLKLSNHSYSSASGWGTSNGNRIWYGNVAFSLTEDGKFGKYTSKARNYDDISYDYPYYLIFKSAGNNRNDLATSNPHRHSGSGTATFTDTHLRDCQGGPGNTIQGFDCIPTYANAKNIMTIGAVTNVLNYTGPSSVNIAGYSGWGPTDDGRIKPDVVAVGSGVFTPNNSSDAGYARSVNGTSLSSPAAAGGSALLVELQNQLYGQVVFRSSTLKALILHTAKEAGANPGPDYTFGWGLADFKAAANLMNLDEGASCANIRELEVNNGEHLQFEVRRSPGDDPLKITMCWTDPAGIAHPGGVVDVTTPALVHDIDIRVSSDSLGTTYLPWVLDPVNVTNGATTGDDSLNNVEQIVVDPDVYGTFVVDITHKGQIDTINGQIVSVIISGIDDVNAPYEEIIAGTYNSPTPVEVRAIAKVKSVGPTDIESPGDLATYAGREIRLNTDFHAVSGGTFLARIAAVEECSPVDVLVNDLDPDDPVGVAVDNLDDNGVRYLLYPNPTSGIVTLKWEASKAHRGVITVTNKLGQKVHQSERFLYGAQTIDLSDQASGIYLITIQTDHQTITEKVVLTE